MNKKKATHVHVGATVRVADPLATGDQRWLNASRGTVVKIPQGKAGVQVHLDGARLPQFVPWSDIDIEQKPRPVGVDLPLSQIRPSRWQYRTSFDPQALLELANSIQKSGLINRILVFQDEEGQDYELIAGERRLRASAAIAIHRDRGDITSLRQAIDMTAAANWWKLAIGHLAGIDNTIAAELRHGPAADFREIVILENLQRQDPTPIDEAEAFRLLIDEEGYTQTALAAKLGKTQGYISQRLGLLGLADGVRDTVRTGAVSFTAARAIATLPEQYQSAVAKQVETLQNSQGDTGATTRQIQTMTRQIKKFLDPNTWLPVDDQVISTIYRNRLRLVHHHIANLDPERADDVITNLQRRIKIGKRVSTIIGSTYDFLAVLRSFTGDVAVYPNGEDLWVQVAPLQNWTCKTCQYRTQRPPAAAQGSLPCPRWADPDRNLESCMHYIGPDDPVIASFPHYAYHDILKELAPDLPTLDGSPYCTDLEHYVQLTEDIAVRLQDQEAAETRAQQQAHLPALRAYYAAQTDDRDLLTRHNAGDLETVLDTSHGLAHTCEYCANYRPDLLDQDLPPCRYALEPLRPYHWNDQIQAPDMGVLIRNDDGVAVPRCAGYRDDGLPVLNNLKGFSFPMEHRDMVLEWLGEILKRGGGGYSHHGTLPSALAWLPYERPDGTTYDIAKLQRYVRDRWDDLGGDTAIAQLLQIAVYESAACGKHQEPITLIEPLSGTSEAWSSMRFADFMARGKKEES